MNEENEKIEALTGPDDIIDTKADDANAEKHKTQEELEGTEPSKDETQINKADTEIKRSE
ncbi:hypothetical protein [Mucilaginibacter pedocola]|uniref:Uncharacterized protein n=1 Tax=Mucilaginibacter pedocola TaxID=1792845 RepID=A0A1S9PKQ2_9SPHI|nr:hypothetical protein [Mucilaginibacter pedocola]OOQ61524.1 hypothetical protein BC343_00130 [Mucilaginibacter pedocola]